MMKIQSKLNHFLQCIVWLIDLVEKAKSKFWDTELFKWNWQSVMFQGKETDLLRNKKMVRLYHLKRGKYSVKIDIDLDYLETKNQHEWTYFSEPIHVKLARQ